MKLKKSLLTAAVLLVHLVSAQLKNESLEPIFSRLSDGSLLTRKDTLQSISYAQKHLADAKADNEYGEAVMAYKALLYLAERKEKLRYSDSMVTAAKLAKDDLLLGTAYMTRATLYYGLKEHTKALDNFLKVDAFISKTDDQYSIYKVKYGIAQTKYYLGFYDEAISLLRECISYFENENERAYLNSLHCLGLCYNRIGKYDWCSLTNTIGIDEGKVFDNSEMEPYFIHSEGVTNAANEIFPRP